MAAMNVVPGETKIGWVGTGVMGLSMCGHLIDKGFSVTVYSRTKSKAETLLAKGATWADSPKAVAEQSDVVASAYEGQDLSFGPEYIIPTPFDPRLITRIAPAVAQAAMDSGVATLPIEDMRAYSEKISNLVYQTGFVMKPVFEVAKSDPRRVIYAEGEDERVLRAIQVVSDEKLCRPISLA